MSAMWTLAPVSVAAGALMMWVFRRAADWEALGVAANRIQAHLMEFWLFVDEPGLVWKSWRGLLGANARLLRLLLVPLVVLSVPMTPLFFCLDAFYGSTPLAVGRPAVVTAGVNQPVEGLSPLPVLRAPEGISVESPAVRVFGQREVSWRVRPQRPVSGKLQLVVGGRTVEKSVEAGQGLRYLSKKRTRSLVELVRYPTEAPLQAGLVDWIAVGYPSASVPFLGWEAHWSVWFIAFSLVGAAVSRMGR
jgi:hypothetical protein